MSSDQPYVPTLDALCDAWVSKCAETSPFTQDYDRIAFYRAIARVRRDAAREALDALQKAELAIIPPEAEETHPTRTQQQALAWRIEMYMLALLPEGDPVNDKTTAADLLEETP